LTKDDLALLPSCEEWIVEFCFRQGPQGGIATLEKNRMAGGQSHDFHHIQTVAAPGTSRINQIHCTSSEFKAVKSSSVTKASGSAPDPQLAEGLVAPLTPHITFVVFTTFRRLTNN
jgi:hypothetical protein